MDMVKRVKSQKVPTLRNWRPQVWSAWNINASHVGLTLFFFTHFTFQTSVTIQTSVTHPPLTQSSLSRALYHLIALPPRLAAASSNPVTISPQTCTELRSPLPHWLLLHATTRPTNYQPCRQAHPTPPTPSPPRQLTRPAHPQPPHVCCQPCHTQSIDTI